MAYTKRYERDPRTGRFAARRPVANLDAKSRFDPMGDSIEDIDNISGAPSQNTIDHPRHAPAGDKLAGVGPSYGSSPLRARNATLVQGDEAVHTVYGVQGAVLRTAARGGGPMDPSYELVTGLIPSGGVHVEGDEDE
jgi:hypothetical protein